MSSSVSFSSSSVGFEASASLWTKLSKFALAWNDCLVSDLVFRHGSILLGWLRIKGLQFTIAQNEFVLVDNAALAAPLLTGVLFAHRNIKRDDFVIVELVFNIAFFPD